MKRFFFLTIVSNFVCVCVRDLLLIVLNFWVQMKWWIEGTTINNKWLLIRSKLKIYDVMLHSCVGKMRKINDFWRTYTGDYKNEFKQKKTINDSINEYFSGTDTHMLFSERNQYHMLCICMKIRHQTREKDCNLYERCLFVINLCRDDRWGLKCKFLGVRCFLSFHIQELV